MAINKDIIINAKLIDNISKDLKKLQSNLNKFSSNVGETTSGINKSFKKANTATSVFFGTLGGFVTGSAIIGGIKSLSKAVSDLGKSIIKAASDMEGFTVQFEVLLGSTESAKKRLEEYSRFASSTPFTLPDIVKSAKQLETFGGEFLSTGENLVMVGDMAAAAGTKFEGVAQWVGRLYTQLAAGRPFGEAAQRLQELGLMSGETRNNLEQMQKQGRSGKEIWDAFSKSMERFDGMMKRQSGTLAGMKSTLSDIADESKRALGSAPLELYKDILKEMLKWWNANGRAVVRFLKNFGEGFSDAVRTYVIPSLKLVERGLIKIFDMAGVTAKGQAMGFITAQQDLVKYTNALINLSDIYKKFQKRKTISLNLHSFLAAGEIETLRDNIGIVIPLLDKVNRIKELSEKGVSPEIAAVQAQYELTMKAIAEKIAELQKKSNEFVSDFFSGFTGDGKVNEWVDILAPSDSQAKEAIDKTKNTTDFITKIIQKYYQDIDRINALIASSEDAKLSAGIEVFAEIQNKMLKIGMSSHEAQLTELQQWYKQRVATIKEYAEISVEHEAEAFKQLSDLEIIYMTERGQILNEIQSEKLEKYKEYGFEMLSFTQELVNQLSSYAQVQRDNDINALQEVYDKRRDIARGTIRSEQFLQKELVKIDKEQQAHEKRIKQEQKSWQIAMSVINIAAGVARAFADYKWPYSLIPAAAVTAAGAVQIATIAAQQFAAGGIVQGDSKNGDKQLVRANAGEVFLNSDQQANLLMKMANTPGGGGGTNISTSNQVIINGNANAGQVEAALRQNREQELNDLRLMLQELTDRGYLRDSVKFFPVLVA